MKHLVIIGTGSFSRELYDTACGSIDYNVKWDIKGCIDGNIKLTDKEYSKLAIPLLGSIEDYDIQADDVFTCAISDTAARKYIIEYMEKRGAEFVNIIHRTAIVSPRTILGKGIILSPYVCTGDLSQIHDYVIMNTHSTIGHDSILGRYTALMAHVDINGNVTIGECVYFGGGSRILPHAKVGDNAYIGAGSVVLKRVKSGAKVFGVPAVPI